MKPYRITRFSLSEAQNHRCCYCACEMTLADDDRPTMATREHVIPRAFGGPTEWWNVVAACRECNSLRGHMYALAFYWMRMQMTVKQIRKIRYDRLMQEDEQYRVKTRENVVVIWFFFKRWFGAPVELAAVPRPHFVEQC